jgi:phage terminase small subunit
MNTTLDDTLNDRQLRFVYEYLQDHNASAAAARAGYSEKSRASAAHELMNNPAVQALLRQELADLLGELRCSALALMKERMRAAFFRPGKMLKGNWELRDLEEMDPEVLGTLEVRSVLRKGGPVLHVKQPVRDKALRALERVHERLDRLNEKYWDRLEKEEKGRARTGMVGQAGARMDADAGAEVEAEAAQQAYRAQVAADELAEKTMVFLGSGGARPRTTADPGGSAAARAGKTSAKTKVFSGSRGEVSAAGHPIAENRLVFDGGDGVAPPLHQARSRAAPEFCAA